MSTDGWPVGKYMALGALATVLLVGGFGLWSARAEISGAVIARGQVEVDSNRQVVQHLDGGVVDGIFVKEGERVDAGALLIRLDPAALHSELTLVENRLYEMLARSARFQAERDGHDQLSFDRLLLQQGGVEVAGLMQGQQQLFDARRDSLAKEREQLTRQREQIARRVDGLRAQQEALATQLNLIGEELADQQSLLERGLAQASRVLALLREEAGIIGRQGELIAATAQAQERMTEIDVTILRLGTARREEAISRLRDLEYNRLELAERQRHLRQRLDRLDIRAPVSGVVFGLAVHAPKSVIRPAEPLLFLVPQDRPLVIGARLDIRDIDQVRVGQPASLRFSSFDRRTAPELFGKVVTVSADAFRDEHSGFSYFRVEILLDGGEVHRLPDALKVVPGMPVDVFLATTSRTPLAFVTKPLMDYFTRAFRSG